MPDTFSGDGLRVVLATPTYGKPHPAYLDAVEAAAPALEAAGFQARIVFERNNPYISAARATLLRKALDAGADAVVFLDHDVSFPPEALVRLIETEGDVVAGTYRFKKDEEEYMGGLDNAPHGFPKVRESDGAVRALRVPAGFLKVTKEAVDRFMGAYPELCYGPKYNPSVDLFNHGAFEGAWIGEDYRFSQRWLACGGDIWIVPDLDLTHHSETQAFPGNYDDFLQRCPGGARHGQRAKWAT